MPDANDRQVGGNHYSKYGTLQPWDLIDTWNLDGFQAAIIPYIVRWKDKDGIRDLEKALHWLEKYIEVQKAKLPAKDAPEIVPYPVHGGADDSRR